MRKSVRKPVRKSLLAFVALLVLLGAPRAWAHVEVSPEAAAKGAAAATFTFSVLNEEAPAKTTSVEIVFPPGVRFDRVSPAPKPGWTPTPSKSSVTWSGGTIAGKEKEAFSLTLGPMPNDAQLVFKAIQTYDDGTVVRWIGAASSDNPAPVVTLTGEPVPTVVESVVTTPPTTRASLTAQDKDGTNVAPIVLGALLLAGIGAGIAIGMRRHARPQA